MRGQDQPKENRRENAGNEQLGKIQKRKKARENALKRNAKHQEAAEQLVERDIRISHSFSFVLLLSFLNAM